MRTPGCSLNCSREAASRREVQEKVDLFLTRIRRMKDWSVSLDLSLVPDSNINQASGGEEECIAFGGMLLCRPLDGEKGGMGLSAGGSFDQYLRFSRDFGLRNSISVQALEYEQGSFDDYQLFLASGPRRTFEHGELSLQPTFRKRWYAADSTAKNTDCALTPSGHGNVSS